MVTHLEHVRHGDVIIVNGPRLQRDEQIHDLAGSKRSRRGTRLIDQIDG